MAEEKLKSGIEKLRTEANTLKSAFEVARTYSSLFKANLDVSHHHLQKEKQKTFTLEAELANLKDTLK